MARQKKNPPFLPDPIPTWLHDLEQQGKSRRTVETYTEDLRDFARWYEDSFGEALAVDAVLPRDVEDYKAYLQTVRKAAPRTVNHRLAALSRFFKWAAGRELIRRDPTVEVRSLRLSPRRPKALTAQEERRLRRVVYRVGDARDIAIVEVLLGTGLRVSELLSLQWGDLQLNARAGRLIVRRGKGGVTRQVPLRREVCQALRHGHRRPFLPLRPANPVRAGRLHGRTPSPAARP